MPEKCLHTLHVCDMPCKRHPVSWLGFLSTGVGRRWILPPPTVLSKQDRGGPGVGAGVCILSKMGGSSPKRLGPPQPGSGQAGACISNCPCFKTQSILFKLLVATPTLPPEPTTAVSLQEEEGHHLQIRSQQDITRFPSISSS